MFHLFVDILVDLGRILGSQQAHSLGTFWAQIGEQGGGGGEGKGQRVPLSLFYHTLAHWAKRRAKRKGLSCLMPLLLEACHIKLILLAQPNLAKLQSHQSIITYLKQDVRLEMYWPVYDMSMTMRPSFGGSGLPWSSQTWSTRFVSVDTNDRPAADKAWRQGFSQIICHS